MCQTNFATEILAEDALKKAGELDAHFQKTGQLVGPLHGIPISVKVDSVPSIPRREIRLLTRFR